MYGSGVCCSKAFNSATTIVIARRTHRSTCVFIVRNIANPVNFTNGINFFIYRESCRQQQPTTTATTVSIRPLATRHCFCGAIEFSSIVIANGKNKTKRNHLNVRSDKTQRRMLRLSNDFRKDFAIEQCEQCLQQQQKTTMAHAENKYIYLKIFERSTSPHTLLHL